jgi:hypothetical protein
LSNQEEQEHVMKSLRKFPLARVAAACLAVLMSQTSHADAVTEWNTVAGDLVVQAKLGTPPAVRVMAIVQTAVHEAVGAAQRLPTSDGASIAVDAAIAAANRTALSRLLPHHVAAIEEKYKSAVSAMADGPAKSSGIAAGEQAAAHVLAWRAEDGAAAADAYRPATVPGTYVPTAPVAAPQWPHRKPWLMATPSQMRPAPPPALASAQWARDYNEVKALGSKNSKTRTPEQTAVARFWEYSLPPIYTAVVQSVARAPGRTAARNARLLAAASQAMDNALIAVFDAKYHYGFWRPVTAIRNGDRDDNAATEVESSWAPLIDNPGHPEYPSAHSILAATVGELIKAEVGDARMPELATSSPSANGETRRWSSADAFMSEVANARIWEGIHYRFSVDAGLAMGKKIAQLAAAQVARPPAMAAPAALSAASGPPAETVTRLGP